MRLSAENRQYLRYLLEVRKDWGATESIRQYMLCRNGCEFSGFFSDDYDSLGSTKSCSRLVLWQAPEVASG